MNFARRCTARTLFSVGFFDTVSPPTSVYAAYNQLPGKKDILREWTLGHECSPEFEQAFLKAVFPATK
ncbi:MAG: Cephalosporin-C deacetylase [bacterium ADurb.Bin429]|nr:MAG: Cephalosporin-C deacetylase [bacterium ADurb.Bin429]